MFWIFWNLWDLFSCEAYDSFQIVCAAFANSVPW